ncbi:hypothetical protein, partial [Enterococcus hirae]|uniref:hypothetical protein n=1 Tax=Enterococcus hirae TaxID=1354 RepID=UPI001964B689
NYSNGPMVVHNGTCPLPPGWSAAALLKASGESADAPRARTASIAKDSHGQRAPLERTTAEEHHSWVFAV